MENVTQKQGGMNSTYMLPNFCGPLSSNGLSLFIEFIDPFISPAYKNRDSDEVNHQICAFSIAYNERYQSS